MKCHPSNNQRISTQPLIAAATLLLLISAVNGDEPRRSFDGVYADQIKAVKATRDRADDLAMARTLLNDARESSDGPEILALIYRQAFELSRRVRDGQATAAESLRGLAVVQPDRRDQTFRELIELWRSAVHQGGRHRGDSCEAILNAMLGCVGNPSELSNPTETLHTLRRIAVLARTTRSPQIDEIDARIESVRHRIRDDGNVRRVMLGAVEDAVVEIYGNGKKVSAQIGEMSGSQLLANGFKKLTIGELNDSRIDANQIKSLRIGMVYTNNNGDSFGVTSDQIRRFRYTDDDGNSRSFKRVLFDHYDGDFEVRVL